MSDTYKHKTQRKNKTLMCKRREYLTGIVATDLWMPFEMMADTEYRNTLSDFCRGPARHGNKRQYMAYCKWKSRKKDRYNLKKDLFERLQEYEE